MGKTTLLIRFLEQIHATSRTVLLFDIDPEFKPRELAAYVLRDLGLKVPDSALEMHDLLKEVLIAEAKANRKFVLVIDEAQNLSDEALEMIRLMSNFETSQSKLMQIVLAGQPQLAATLRKPSLLQFRQRISYFCRIDPLSKEETRAYIAERLKYADYKGKNLFSEKALELISDASRGTPRIINTLCFNALSLCHALKEKQVNESMVREIIADHRLGLALGPVVPRAVEPPKPTPLPTPMESAPIQPRSVTSRFHSSPPPFRLNVGKAALSSAALILLLAGVAFGAYRTFWGGTFVKVDAAPHVEASAPTDAPFEVSVQPNQSIGSIARQYLGDFNAERLRQIRALNPWMTNPDHVQVGQKVLLPGPRPAITVGQARNAATDKEEQ